MLANEVFDLGLGPGVERIMRHARVAANSVLAPQDGITRPDSSEYFAGIGRNELSECHSRSASLKNRARSWPT